MNQSINSSPAYTDFNMSNNAPINTTERVLPPIYLDNVVPVPVNSTLPSTSGLPYGTSTSGLPYGSTTTNTSFLPASGLSNQQNQSGKGGKGGKKLQKQLGIKQQLTQRLAPPAGDPAVNHYRRGAKAAVPLAGPTTRGIENGRGNRRGRKIGRSNNYGSRVKGTIGVLPVPATQPPIVAPVYGSSLSSGMSNMSLNGQSSYLNSNQYSSLNGQSSYLNNQYSGLNSQSLGNQNQSWNQSGLNSQNQSWSGQPIATVSAPSSSFGQQPVMSSQQAF